MKEEKNFDVLEVGCYYQDMGGRIWGPAEIVSGKDYPFTMNNKTFTEEGYFHVGKCYHCNNLVKKVEISIPKPKPKIRLFVGAIVELKNKNIVIIQAYNTTTDTYQSIHYYYEQDGSIVGREADQNYVPIRILNEDARYE